MIETIFVTTMFLSQMATHERPEVRRRSREEMCLLSKQKKNCPSPNKGSFSVDDPYIVNIRADVDVKTVFGQGVLVHEFVHFLQYHTGKLTLPLTCPDYYFKEREAVMIQVEFYAHSGYIYQGLPELLTLYANVCWKKEKEGK